MATILWFKRDLRVEDNPALAAAAASGGVVLPLYIIEPELWAQPDASARQWRFVAESLGGLAADLARLGAPLLLRMGDPVAVLEDLRVAHGVTRLISHQETGTLWTYARDIRIADWARGQGVSWQELPQPGILRGRPPGRGWSARRDKALRQPLAVTPDALPPHGLSPGTIPDAADLRLPFDPCPGRQKGGRARGLDLLATVQGAQTVGSDSSRLSPHLAHGTLSMREVVQAIAAGKCTAAAPARALSGLTTRLARRDRLMQTLENRPDMECRCLHPAYEGLHPTRPDALRLAAWQAGETGLPFVDACMRALIQTGWISDPMRAMLVTVACHHLWLDWRRAGQHMARSLTDYEPGILWPQVQLLSGVTGAPLPRIPNPVKQGLLLDPQGGFIRQWLPELRPVPDAFLHQPWLWAGAGRFLGHAYPAPVVDPVRAARLARHKLAALRDAAGWCAAPESQLQNHGAHRPKPRKQAATGPRQLSLPI